MIDNAYPLEWAYGWARHWRPRRDIRRGLRIVVQPASEPIDVYTAQQHLRLNTSGSPPVSDDDALLTGVYIPAAREACENYLGRALAPQVAELTLDRFPGSWSVGLHCAYPHEIELPLPPLSGVESVSYTDTGGTLQTLDASTYVVDTRSLPGRVVPAPAQTWPTAGDYPAAVTVRYACGYSTPSDSPQDEPMPAAIRAAMLLTLAHLYENREATFAQMRETIVELPLGVKYLLDPYRADTGLA